MQPIPIAELLRQRAAIITDLVAAREFALAGNAYFTLRSLRTGTRFTYRVVLSETNNVYAPTHFVKLRTGHGDHDGFQYLGHITNGNYFLGKKAIFTADAPAHRAFQWFWALERIDPEKLEFWHEGRCGCCGRRLTDPASIRRGIGPTCASALRIVA